jgi:steroid 5-alpha reductase family enzyme
MSDWAIVLAALGAALGMMTLAWLLSLLKRDASIIDIFWGLGFALLAWVYFAVDGAILARAYLVLALVTLWGLRLSAYILWRNWGAGEDYRYQEMRARNPGTFAVRSLFTVFFLQAILLWAISMPLFQAVSSAQPAALTGLDVLGLALFVVGFLFEAGGDWQLASFKADPANAGKVMDRGFWRYTRHPNYFGDALVWWGFFCFALATPGSLWTIYSPVLMTVLLMRVSGVTLLEKRLQDTKPQYRDYAERTNAFFPWFPRRGERRGGPA